MSLSLYNIAEDLVKLKDLRDGAESEGDTEAVAIIDGQIAEWVKGCLATKADGIRGFMRTLEAQTEIWKDEADRYAKLAHKSGQVLSRIKSYILDAMRLLDAKKIEGAKGDVVLRRRGNGGVKPLVIAQPDMVPDDYCYVPVKMSPQAWNNLKEMYPAEAAKCSAGERTILYDRVRGALERGEGVAGCRLDERGESLIVE